MRWLQERRMTKGPFWKPKVQKCLFSHSPLGRHLITLGRKSLLASGAHIFFPSQPLFLNTSNTFPKLTSQKKKKRKEKCYLNFIGCPTVLYKPRLRTQHLPQGILCPSYCSGNWENGPSFPRWDFACWPQRRCKFKSYHHAMNRPPPALTETQLECISSHTLKGLQGRPYRNSAGGVLWKCFFRQLTWESSS